MKILELTSFNSTNERLQDEHFPYSQKSLIVFSDFACQKSACGSFYFVIKCRWFPSGMYAAKELYSELIKNVDAGAIECDKPFKTNVGVFEKGSFFVICSGKSKPLSMGDFYLLKVRLGLPDFTELSLKSIVNKKRTQRA